MNNYNRPGSLCGVLVLGVTAQKKTLEKKKERVQGKYNSGDQMNETVSQ